MGKPRKKERAHPNKSRRGDIIFEKIESNAFFDENHKANAQNGLHKIISNNYLPTICEWISQTQYHDEIISFLKQMKTVPYSQLIDLGTQFSWDFAKMNEKITLSLPCPEMVRGQVLLRTDEICEICQEPQCQFYQFECGHAFCLGCCKNYLLDLLKEGTPAIVKKTCPKDGCKNMISFECWEEILGKDTQALVKYRGLMLNFLIATKNSKLHQCPFPSCTQLFSIKKFNLIKTVSCPSGHSFCWQILFSCKDLRFLEYSPNSAISLCWIVSNTKNCPQCRAPIQKNEGCNHMTCKRCTHQFCWLCQSRWGGHVSDSLSCQTLRARYEQDLEIKKQKAQFRAFFCQKFPNLLQESESSTHSLMLKKQVLLSHLEKTDSNTNQSLKKKAKVFAHFIFEMQNSVEFAIKTHNAMNTSNMNYENLVQLNKKISNSLACFSSLFGSHALQNRGLMGYYSKNHQSPFIINKVLQISDDFKKLKNIMSNL